MRSLAALPAAARAMLRVLALVLACVTCDATTALRPPEERAVTLAWAGDTVVVVGGTLAPQVTAAIDGEPYALARLVLTSSDTSVVGIGADGQTLLGRRLGHAVLTVRMLSTTLPTIPTMTRDVVVSPAAIRIGGAVDTLFSLGDTVRLAASAVDANDVAIPTSGIRWSSSDTSVLAVDALGLVTARRNGAAVVRAALGAQVAETPIEVWQKAARLSFSLPQLTLDAISAESTLVAVPLDARGGLIARSPAPEVTWSSAAPAVATVTGGRVTAVGNGAAWIRASAAGARDSVRVDVAQRATRVVIETPGPLVLSAVGETAIARARGYDRYDHEVTSTLPAWRTLNPQVAYVESRTGIVTGLATGTGELVAEQDGVSATLAVAVSNPPAQLILEPATATITSVGDTLAMRWSVRNSRGVEIAGAPVTLASSDTTIVRAIGGARITAVATGTVRVTATADGGVADTSFVTVINAVENVDFPIDLETMSSVGDSVWPPVIIRNARGEMVDRSAATWSSDDPGTARVTANGMVVATGAGETKVRVSSPTYPDRRDSLVVVVTNAPASVVIERAADTLTAVGASRAYSAEVRNGRGALLPVTPEWRTLDGSVARVSSTGLATAVGIGTARLVATAGTAADTLLLTVRDEVATVEVTPAVVTLTSLGDVLRPTVVARNALGTVVADPRVTWAVIDTNVVRLQADTTLLAVGTGTTRVVATSGRGADTMAVTVTNLPVSIDIVPGADTIRAIGDSLALPVTIRNARGDLLPSTTVTWTVDDPVVARVSVIGFVTARAVGGTWVRATGGTARDSAYVVVTNEPASIAITLAASGLAATVDTMTANGQSLAYAATAYNSLGRPIADATVTWTSSATSVASASYNGTVTAMGVGTALVVARAGAVADTVRVTVVNPTRIYVDNGVVMATRFGTPSRPYATIQDGIDAAGVDDTVIVRRGTGYSESVALGRRVTLLGDSTDFVAGGRDPLLLPRIGHDLGPAGITASTAGASYTIRYLAVQHSVDGDAVAIRDADNVLLDYVYVNPVAGFRTGRGVLVERATGSVLVARGRVDSVYAWGVRVVESQNVRIDGMTARAVGARTGASGAGFEVSGGTGAVITGVAARRTAGPQVLLSGTTGASLLSSTFVGEQQLVRLTGVLGTTTVRGNSFDMRRQAGEAAPPRTGTAPDPSALEVVGSAGVVVDANAFTDIGQGSLMDGVRLADVRVGTTGAAFGAMLSANRFAGGRYAVRAGRATFTLTGARIDSASVGVLLADADSATIDVDTIAAARVAAVQSTGAGARVVMTGSVVTGPQRAVVASGAAQVVLRGNTVTGAAGVATPQPALGALDLAATSIEVVANALTNSRGWAALVLRNTARVDSNVVSRNLVGVRWTAASSQTLTMRYNSLFDNDTLPASARRARRGFVNDGSNMALGDNWWGDPRGPSLNVAKPPATFGDSAIGPGSFPYTANPLPTHAGTGAMAELRKVGGDGQAGTIGSYTTDPFAVRVVDAQGRPLAGVAVTFKVPRTDANMYNSVRSGNDNVSTVTTDANGLAWTIIAPLVAGTITTTATAGASSMTFTTTVP